MTLSVGKGVKSDRRWTYDYMSVAKRRAGHIN